MANADDVMVGLIEADPSQYRNLEANRPRSWTYHGAVCTRGAGNTTRLSIAGPKFGGWSGMRETMEPTRKGKMARNVDVPCYYLPDLLERHGLRRVDYLTIDTEGSELSFVEDFPWAEYDVRVVQIEQLDELRYKAQRGREHESRRTCAPTASSCRTASSCSRGTPSTWSTCPSAISSRPCRRAATCGRRRCRLGGRPLGLRRRGEAIHTRSRN